MEELIKAKIKKKQELKMEYEKNGNKSKLQILYSLVDSCVTILEVENINW